MDSYSHCDIDQMISRNVSGSGAFDGCLETSSGPTSSSHSFLPHHPHLTSKINNIFHQSSNGQNGYSQVMINSSMKTIGDCDTVNNNNNHHLPHHSTPLIEEESSIESAFQNIDGQTYEGILPDEKVNIKDEPDLLASVIEEEDDTPEIDIKISNVVSNFACRCHLNLKNIAMKGSNVVYKRETGMLIMKIRNPPTTASIWSSGKIVVTGANSEPNAKIAARKIARILQKMGYNVRMTGFRITNVLGNVDFPFGIRLKQFAQTYPKICSYEPELHPGATYKCDEVKGTLTIFQTGAITITAPSVNAVDIAVNHIYPLVHDFQKEKPQDKHLAHMRHAALKEQNERESRIDDSKKRKKMQNKSRKSKRVRIENGHIDGSDEEEGSDIASLIDDDSTEEFGHEFTSESEAKSTSAESSDDE